MFMARLPIITYFCKGGLKENHSSETFRSWSHLMQFLCGAFKHSPAAASPSSFQLLLSLGKGHHQVGQSDQYSLYPYLYLPSTLIKES